MLTVFPDNHYWFVGGDTTQVYSSASASTVPVSDATYQAWLANGPGTSSIDTQTALADYLRLQGVKPYRSVSPRQIRIALNIQGLRPQVENWISTQDANTQDSWAHASVIVEDNALIAACMTAIGKTDADRTALFNLAATIT